jgi:opacity protein-like surface antigen
MRIQIIITAAALLVSSAAFAQPANPKGDTPAVNTPSTRPNPDAPVAGANSFTEGQAKSRIEANGFTNVTELRKDDQGVWRAKATKDGRSVNVSLDFQGNVVTP